MLLRALKLILFADNGTLGPETTSYCAMTEVEPNVVVVTYDRLAAGWNGPPGPYGAADAVFAMRIKIAPSKCTILSPLTNLSRVHNMLPKYLHMTANYARIYQ